MDVKPIDKVKTGVTGLDEMTGGGLPFPAMVLVAGEPGTGKTTLCMQYLCKGAEMGERGLYFTALGEPPECMLGFISTYDFVDPGYFQTSLRYVDLGNLARRDDPEGLLGDIASEVAKFEPKRVVFDSIAILEELMMEEYGPFVVRLIKNIKSWQSTTLVTGEPEASLAYPSDMASVAEGVIILYNQETGYMRKRAIEILKMVGTAHRSGKHAVDISQKGFNAYPGL